jgi:hypothetical protein
MLRSIVAMVVGFLTLNAVVIASGVTLQALGLTPGTEAPVTPAILVWNLSFNFLGAVLAGLVCGVAAQRAPLAHASGLAGTVFFVSIGYTHRLWIAPPPADLPHWYLLTLLVVPPVGIVLGGVWQQNRRRDG